MRRHALSDRAFADLGAGRPSLETVAELRRAQLSRHLLLLRSLRLSSGYASLHALEHENRAAFRRFVEDPLTGAWAAAELRAGGGESVIELSRGMSRRLAAEHDGLSIEVRLEDADERRGLLGLTPTGRLTDDEAAHWARCFAEAWRVLVGRHRDAALRLRAVLTCVIPVEADPAAAGISATSADAFGAVAMSMPADGVSLAVGLLHEAQHSLLNATSHLFDLHQKPHERGYSPWRDDPRPASGVLHGAYAYLAVTRFWRTESRAGAGRLATFEYERWRAAVATTAARLLAGGKLTGAGMRFVSALHDEVKPWLAEPSPDPEVTRLVQMANTDHYTRWRLRNMTPDPSGIAALAKAWREGRPPPEVPSSLTPATQRALPHSPRLHQIHAQLRERNSAPTPSKPAPTPSEPVSPADEGRKRGGSAEHEATTEDAPIKEAGALDVRAAPAEAALAGAAPAGAAPAEAAPAEAAPAGAASAGAASAGAASAGADGAVRPEKGGRADGVDSVGLSRGGQRELGESRGASGQTRVSRATALELAFLRGDHGTFRHAYSDQDFDLDPTALAMVAGVEGRIEALVAIWRELRGEGVDPVALADWLARRAPADRTEVADAEET